MSIGQLFLLTLTLLVSTTRAVNVCQSWGFYPVNKACSAANVAVCDPMGAMCVPDMSSNDPENVAECCKPFPNPDPCGQGAYSLNQVCNPANGSSGCPYQTDFCAPDASDSAIGFCCRANDPCPANSYSIGQNCDPSQGSAGCPLQSDMCLNEASVCCRQSGGADDPCAEYGLYSVGRTCDASLGSFQCAPTEMCKYGDNVCCRFAF